MDEAAPAAAAPQAEKKKSLLRRVPTPLVVTLVGIALTAWLLPAFTRQWDDRQKAQELKATIVSDIAAATADGITTGETTENGTASTVAARADATRRWSLRTLRIESRLRAYFSSGETLALWVAYAYALGRFSGVSGETRLEDELLGLYLYVHGRADDAHVSESELAGKFDSVFPDSSWYEVGGVIHGLAKVATLKRYRASFSPYERSLLESLSGMLPTYPLFGPKRASPLRNVEVHLLALDQFFTARILAAHPAGYSTTTHDLVHDLIP